MPSADRNRAGSGEDAPRAFLRRIFDCAVAAADPMRCVPMALPPKASGRVLVIGAGKASARMAEAVESAWGPCEGLVITRDGYARPLQGIEVVEASHPIPDERGFAATRRMIELLRSCREGDLVLALISGGGSSLLTCPAGTVTLEEEQEMTRALLSSGAPIHEMNIIRKHLSAAKGGNLAAAAWPARVLSLIISDVAGDDPALIASGPTVADRSTRAQVREAIARWSIPLSSSMERVLSGPPTTWRADARELSRAENRIVAAPSQSLEAAADLARKSGCDVDILGDALEGEARDMAADHAQIALERQAERRVEDPPLLLLSGGECTVTRRGNGLGGPNAEYALALALALDRAPRITALAGDTDGVDGAAEVAGAVIDEATLTRGPHAKAALACNDSHAYFAGLGDQIVTGPTLTNVNDFRAILISGRTEH